MPPWPLHAAQRKGAHRHHRTAPSRFPGLLLLLTLQDTSIAVTNGWTLRCMQATALARPTCYACHLTLQLFWYSPASACLLGDLSRPAAVAHHPAFHPPGNLGPLPMRLRNPCLSPCKADRRPDLGCIPSLMALARRQCSPSRAPTPPTLMTALLVLLQSPHWIPTANVFTLLLPPCPPGLCQPQFPTLSLSACTLSGGAAWPRAWPLCMAQRASPSPC